MYVSTIVINGKNKATEVYLLIRIRLYPLRMFAKLTIHSTRSLNLFDAGIQFKKKNKKTWTLIKNNPNCCITSPHKAPNSDLTVRPSISQSAFELCVSSYPLSLLPSPV